MHTADQQTCDTENSFELLRYEIDRAKSLLQANGESPAMRERLQRLEALLDICRCQ